MIERSRDRSKALPGTMPAGGVGHGRQVSSGCIRLTNEDVIDLYNRVKMGTIVVVLEPKHGDSPFNSQMALQGGGNAVMQ